MAELIKPCPFCGKKVRHSTVPSSQFQCKNKRCALYLSVVYATVEQWNERQSGLTLPVWQERAAQRTLSTRAAPTSEETEGAGVLGLRDGR